MKKLEVETGFAAHYGKGLVFAGKTICKVSEINLAYHMQLFGIKMQSVNAIPVIEDGKTIGHARKASRVEIWIITLT